MKLKSLSKEELEAMSYTDLSIAILEEKGSKLKTVDIFKKICNLLGLSDKDFENKIADFFGLITTDKNFVVLDKGYCDLSKRHTKKVTIEEEDEDVDQDAIISEEDIPEETEEKEEDIFYDSSSDEDDVDDDDDELSDFAIVDDDDEASL